MRVINIDSVKFLNNWLTKHDGTRAYKDGDFRKYFPSLWNISLAPTWEWNVEGTKAENASRLLEPIGVAVMTSVLRK